MDIGIGVNTGAATVGNLGAPEFHDYTAIGDTVNLGSRLEGLNKEYGTQIIIGEKTYERVRGEFFCRELDVVRVKGKVQPVIIYELLARKDEATEEQKRLATEFGRHLALYRNRQFEKACAAFEALGTQFANDGPCRIYAERCRILVQNPPEETWSGVFTFTTK
jgi:adenylate cyclase